MGLLADILLYPGELLPLLRVRREAKALATHTYSDEDLAFCYRMLNRLSKSFAFVIQQLPAAVRHAVCVFYLVLRALDTVEDDMGVGNAEKIPILIAFHEHVTDPNWTYVCGTKDFRKLMQHLHHLRRALEKLDPKYRMVILDITKRMGAGMAMYITAEVETEQQYQDYCHYVAGLVGIGLSAIFHHSGLEPLADEGLSNTMGLFLQNTNIIRDYLEDIEEEPAPRMFWPRAVWGKYAQQLEDLKDVGANGTAAVQCLNDMVTIALSHAPHCLCFLAQVHDAQIFRFWAIPQIMAMATLTLCYNNIQVFQKEIKPRLGLAAKVMDQTWSMVDVRSFFHAFALELLAKVHDADPSAQATRANLAKIISLCKPGKKVAGVEGLQGAGIGGGGGSGSMSLFTTSSVMWHVVVFAVRKLHSSMFLQSPDCLPHSTPSPLFSLTLTCYPNPPIPYLPLNPSHPSTSSLPFFCTS
ncbi:unnamed protein product [Closterium sp. Naga37s-1]|nr:unnamed protein product [Closterium sp. Naga37s-1]